MQSVAVKKSTPLDRPVLSLLKLDWEKTLYIVLILLALGTRLWGLGWRGMSHDESLHVVYSHKLYAGEGYQHDPMMHGPFLFHANALAYFLFGADDFTGRLVPALFGVALVLIPWFFRRWLGRIGALAMSLMLLISPTISYYSRYIRNDVYILVFGLGVLALLFHYLESRRTSQIYGIAALLSLMFATKEVAFIFVLIVGIFLAAAALLEWLRDTSFPPKKTPLLDMVVLFGTLSLPLAAAFVVKGLGFDPLDYSFSGILRSGGVFLVLFLISAAIGLWWDRKRWLTAVGIYYLIFVLLYTTFFTNGKGLATGLMGSLGYWLNQQAVERGSQPWYYYGVLLPLYEFMPLVFGVGAIGAYVLRRRERTAPAAEMVFGITADSGEGSSPRQLTGYALFMPFMIYHALLTVIAYSYAGEKMPWLTVHLALPFIILAAWLVNRALRGVDWREAWQKGGGIFALSLGLLVFAVAELFSLQPFRGRQIEQLSETMGWIAAFLVAAGLVWIVTRYAGRLGVRLSGQVAFASVFVLLSLFTVRSMWMANYINYDYAKEYLVYAHATPDIKLAVNDLKTLSQRLYGDTSMKFAYDDDSTWPLEWYVREFPNATYYGAQPTKEALDAPVVIAGDKNWDKVKPFLGNRYYRFDYKLIWWPLENYRDLTLAKIWDTLTDPAKREKLWNIVYYRKYEEDPATWPLRHQFAMFVRKDVANQVWSFGATPPEAFEMPEDIYFKGMRDVVSVSTIGSAGAGPGQLTEPRNVAVGPDGRIYVLDTANHRIQVFDADGQFVTMWGSEGSGPGQLNEPWGIAMSPDGFVYVADTWNHRVVKFTSDGQFVGQWGYFGSTEGALGQPAVFWGPRAVAVNSQGTVYVTDTGNKRVQAFDAEGQFLAQWGGFGAEPGQFHEPVGIAIDRDDNIYVADTWNRRVQKFDPQFTFIKAWDILSWEGESTVNKPYLTVGTDDRLYISDPEGYRVLVYDLEGSFVASFGLFGSDAKSFNLPTGITAGPDGFIYVADTGNHRIMKFATLP